MISSPADSPQSLNTDPQLADPPVRPSSVNGRTVIVFALVLLAHLLIAWWVLGARFGKDLVSVQEPIMITVISDDGGGDTGSGDAAGDDSAGQQSPTEAPASAEHTTQPGPAGAVAQPEHAVSVTSPTSSQPTSGELARIGLGPNVDKPVDKPVEKSVEKRVEKAIPRDARQATTPVKNATTKSEVAQDAAAQSQAVATGAATNAATGLASAAATVGGGGAGGGPRRIERPDYLGGPPNPSYPASARNRRQQGSVVVRVVINTAGQPATVDIFRSSGFELLDRAAIDAVQRARFRPYAENGVPLEAQVDIPFEFVLRN